MVNASIQNEGTDQHDTRNYEGYMCPQNCLCRNKAVNCTGQNLTSLPGNIPTDTELLYLTHNKFATLGNNTFRNLTTLQGLWLGFNQLLEIGVETFAHLKKLRYLDLSKNPLSMEVLEQSVFCALPKTPISVLNITRLPFLKNFTEKSMGCLRKTSLKKIDVSYGKFYALCNLNNGTFSGMKNLTVIYFTLMQCDKFNKFSLKNASILTDLWLSHNQLTYVPSFILDQQGTPLLPHLKTLMLDHNRISNLRKGWYRGLENVQNLSLAHNDIEFLRENEFSKLSHLQVLHLHNNRIRSINETAFASNSLRSISIYSNPLTLDKLPPDLFRNAIKIEHFDGTTLCYKLHNY